MFERTKGKDIVDFQRQLQGVSRSGLTDLQEIIKYNREQCLKHDKTREITGILIAGIDKTVERLEGQRIS